MIGKYQPAFGLTAALAAAIGGGATPQQLTEQLARTFGVRHVLLFESARHALFAVLRALGRPGSVVVPAYNCIAVPEAVGWAGWRPVLADVAPGDLNMTPETLRQSLTQEVRAVLLTHQFGIPSDVDRILAVCRARGLFVIEDAAAALGAKYRGRLAGTFGDAAVISFHLTKVANAGRGGALLTNDDTIAGRVAALQSQRGRRAASTVDFARALAWWAVMRPRTYGLLRQGRRLLKHDAVYEVVTPNARPPLDALCRCSSYVASLASRQLDALASNIAARQALARIYTQELSGVSGLDLPPLPEGAEPAWIQFPIFVDQKQGCYEYLLSRGVDLNWTFRYSCGASYGQHAPQAERAARSVLGLPTYPGLPCPEAKRIGNLIRQFMRG